MHRRIVMTALVLAAPFVFWACTITPEATADKDTLYESQDEELIPDIGW